MKHVWRVVGASVVAVLLLTTVSYATIMDAATHTRLTLSDRSISAGTRETFTGAITSSFHGCVWKKKVGLFKNGSPFASGTTNGDGVVTFTFKLFKTAFWQLRYVGQRAGSHTNRHYCKPSRSKNKKVEVKGSGGAVLGTGGSVLGAGGSTNPSSALTGRELLGDLRLLAVLIITGLAAIVVGRRRLRAGRGI